MTPYETMISMYDRYREEHPDSMPFCEVLEWYSRHGFIFITPDFFCMGRPVCKSASEALICSPHVFDPADCDCWYVHAMAGSLQTVWDILPWPLGWIAFDRKLHYGNVGLRFYPTESLRHHMRQEDLP